MKIKLATGLDELIKAMAIRAVIFMGEQKHSYNMEFSGDDFNNRMHLLAYDGDEPVGTVRIHKEGNSAKFERLAVLPAYRGKGVAQELMAAGIDLCRKDNIENLYLFCKPELLNYWQQQGYKRVGGNKLLQYKQLNLIPVMKKLDPDTPLSARELLTIPPLLSQQSGEWIETPHNVAFIINQARRKDNSKG